MLFKYIIINNIINELLRINELIIIKFSNRFSKAKNKKKRIF